MRRKLWTKRGRTRYALRMETVEPVFGQIKQGRGFRQFPLRRLEKVTREWLLICAGHNLMKLFRFGGGRTGGARDNRPAQNSRQPTVLRPLEYSGYCKRTRVRAGQGRFPSAGPQ